MSEQASHYFKTEPGSKSFPTFVLSQRRLESTDEIELVDRNVEQNTRIHERLNKQQRAQTRP
jgi:hypothetical protein